MSAAEPGPRPYEVIYSIRVQERILELADEASRRGSGTAFSAALADFHYRLRVYPQFGDPLIDLQHEVGHLRLGIVPPLTMRYGVLEERRMVFVGTLPVLLVKR